MVVAQQPTSNLPELIDVATAVANEQSGHEMNPRMRSLFNRIGAALSGGDASTWIDAQNELQDLIDEGRDFLRGSGG